MTNADVFRVVGHHLRDLFAGLDVRIGIAGSHANLAYRSRVPVAVETAAGLTDAFIAHIEISARGQTGHERSHLLYPGYLERRGVHFMLEMSYARDNSADPYRALLLPAQPVPVPARLVTYDRELMRQLRARAPRIDFVDFEAVLDDYIADLGNKDPVRDREAVARDYQAFREFYFDHNDDAERQRAFTRFLGP